MSIRSEILNQFVQIGKEYDRSFPPLADDLSLVDSGLDWMCLAALVDRLEGVLGIDPLKSTEDGNFPVTIGDLIKVYELALKSA